MRLSYSRHALFSRRCRPPFSALLQKGGSVSPAVYSQPPIPFNGIVVLVLEVEGLRQSTGGNLHVTWQ
jgi:hypothetical protein